MARDRENMSREELLALVQEQYRHMDEFMNSVPGAVVCFRKDDGRDEGLDLLWFSDGLCALTGYTREEIRRDLHDHYRLLILPEDRARTHASALEQAERAPDAIKELQYRLRRKDGGVIWVLDRGRLNLRNDGTGVYNNIILDVDKLVRERERLRLSLERHQIILDQTSDVLFEWDIQHNTLSFSGNVERKFGSMPRVERVEELLSRAGGIYPEDRAALLESMGSMKRGAPYTEVEARLPDTRNRYLWFRIRATLQLDGDGRPAKAVGILVDIDAEKRATQRLQAMAERDSLTGLYNRGAAQTLIEEGLREVTETRPAALMVLDLDEFKLVNDTLGHPGGDALLADFATILRGSFRKGDVVGRIGGDEFCVLMQDVGSREDVRKKLWEVQSALGKLFGGGQPLRSSCSIGVALAPEDGTDFEDLFRKADAALYEAKGSGKNGTAFFHALPEDNALGQDAARALEPNTLCGQLALHVFQLIYRSSDVETAVSLILEIMGKRLDVSRAYILELTADGLGMRKTFRWENDRHSVPVDRPGTLPCHRASDVLTFLKREGSYCCEDTSVFSGSPRTLLEELGVTSFLMCTIRDGDTFRGCVGVDECRGPRTWSRSQRSVVAFIAELSSVFLMKDRAQKRQTRTLASMKRLLDFQDEWIYVVDRSSRAVLYANAAALRRTSGGYGDTACYRLLAGRDSPCEGCPVDRMEGETSLQWEMYSPAMGTRIQVKAATLLWEGEREACLMSCRPAIPDQNQEAGRGNHQ